MIAPGNDKRRGRAAARRHPAPRRLTSGSAHGDKATIRRLRRELAQAMAGIAELGAMAETDSLLDILNRRGFERELHRSISYIKRYHASAALVLLDVDRLKPINDSFGHAAGDQVLKAVVAALSAHVRASDLIGRLGGDEFVMMLWNLSEADARAKAASLEDAIDGLSFVFDGRTVKAGASAGVAMLGVDADANRAIAEADSAMYLRKAARRRAGGSNPSQDGPAVVLGTLG